MISDKKAGFTIVEVMLFLGISGLLFMGVMTGTGSAINAQRYRDSVSSLQSILQQQYSEVSNVINDNTTNVCRLESDTTQATKPRGQSDCVALGRFITTTDGLSLSIKNVIGKQVGSSGVASNDVQALSMYDMVVSPVGESSYEIEWGAKLTSPVTNSLKGFSMLVLRSPLSGVVRTFLNDDTPNPTDENHLSSFLTGSPPPSLSKSVELCVDANGLTGGPKMAVLIDANTTNESGIQTLGVIDQSNLGTGSVCN